MVEPAKLLLALSSMLLGGSLLAQSDKLEDRIRFAAEYQLEEGTTSGVILVSVNITEDNYIYSLSPQKGGPPPSKISVSKSDHFQLSGSFTPDKAPTVVELDPSQQTRLEKHYGQVIFWVPIEIAPNAQSEQLSIDLKFNGTVCSPTGSCFMIRGKKIPVKFGGYYKQNSP